MRESHDLATMQAAQWIRTKPREIQKLQQQLTEAVQLRNTVLIIEYRDLINDVCNTGEAITQRVP